MKRKVLKCDCETQDVVEALLEIAQSMPDTNTRSLDDIASELKKINETVTYGIEHHVTKVTILDNELQKKGNKIHNEYMAHMESHFAYLRWELVDIRDIVLSYAIATAPDMLNIYKKIRRERDYNDDFTPFDSNALFPTPEDCKEENQ